jgi:predicted small lipoprotein YifL
MEVQQFGSGDCNGVDILPALKILTAHLHAPHTGEPMARLTLVLLVALSCSACGLKGDLYLPQANSTPVVVSTSASSSSASSSSQAAP